jgi:hypothetical protein
MGTVNSKEVSKMADSLTQGTKSNKDTLKRVGCLMELDLNIGIAVDPFQLSSIVRKESKRVFFKAINLFKLIPDCSTCLLG